MRTRRALTVQSAAVLMLPALAPPAPAGQPLATDWTFQLQCRSSLDAGIPAFNLPQFSSLSSQYVSLGERHGALIADHTPDGPEGMGSNIAGLVIGVDPASCIMGGVDPEQRVHKSGAIRLTDANPSGRCVVGGAGSRLDLSGYAGACLTSGQRWIVTDAWGIDDADKAIRTAVTTWRDAVRLPL